jgi:hypothetical protein
MHLTGNETAEYKVSLAAAFPNTIATD